MPIDPNTKRDQDLLSSIKILSGQIELTAQRLKVQKIPANGTIAVLWQDMVLLRDLFQRYQERHPNE